MTTYVRVGNTVGMLLGTDSRNESGKYKVMDKHSGKVDNFAEVSVITEHEYAQDPAPQPTKQATKRGSKKS